MGVIESSDQSDGMGDDAKPSVRIHTEISTKINFASHQNAFPLLRDLSIENLDEENRLEGLLLISLVIQILLNLKHGV